MTLTLITSHTFLATSVYPNLDGIGGPSQLKTVIRALMSIMLIVAVLMMIVCAATWGVGSPHGNYPAATKARTGLLVAAGAVTLDGAGMPWIDFSARDRPDPLTASSGREASSVGLNS